jgi:TM2 domain-containing membrane protein YozV
MRLANTAETPLDESRTGGFMSEVYRVSELSTLSSNNKHCYACASVLDMRAELCPHCGVRQPMVPGMPHGQFAMAPAMPMATTTKSKTAAILFAFFLGGIGIHKFYLGQVASGIVYLLFFWTFIPAFIAFIEFIVLLTMSEDTFARRYPA